MSDADRWDIAIAEMDAYDGDLDLEDCDSEDADGQDHVAPNGTMTHSQSPWWHIVCRQLGEDDEPDGPAEVWDE